MRGAGFQVRFAGGISRSSVSSDPSDSVSSWEDRARFRIDSGPKERDDSARGGSMAELPHRGGGAGESDGPSSCDEDVEGLVEFAWEVRAGRR
jgi:hypothetical protein